MTTEGNEKPEGLSELGEKAYQVIMNVMTKNNMTYTGGCKTFYSPKEWAERGEEYGLDSELIVVYDGGEVKEFFCYLEENDDCMEIMDQALASVGVYDEPCTCWYSAIYPRG